MPEHLGGLEGRTVHALLGTRALAHDLGRVTVRARARARARARVRVRARARARVRVARAPRRS